MRRSMVLSAAVGATLCLTALPGASASSAPPLGRLALATKVAPTAVRVADLNGDGLADVVAAVGLPEQSSSFTWGVSVLLGTGDGRTRPAVRYEVPERPDSIEVADVDGDGVLDVLATTSTDGVPGFVYGLAGTGDGRLDQAAPVGEQAASAIAVGELGGGPGADLAMVGEAGLVVAYQGAGFELSDPEVLDGAVSAGHLAAVDLDGNGVDELAVAIDGGPLTVFAGSSRGTSVATPDGVHALRTGDADGDGTDELLATSLSGALAVHGAGLAVERSLPPVGDPAVAAVGDVDGDGRPDIVRVADLKVHVQPGGGAPAFASRLTAPAADVAVADLTGDGRDDVLASETDASVVEVLTDVAAPFQPRRTVTFDGGWDTQLADLNGDGVTDMLAGNCNPYADGLAESRRVDSYLGDGKGGFERKGSVTFTGSASCHTRTGDFNGDGQVDFAMANYYTGGIHQFWGNGDGTFGPDVPMSACHLGDGLATADVNADGYTDALFVCRAVNTPGSVAVLAGSPAGLVRTPVLLPYQFNAGTYLIRTGDINGDQHVDVVVGSFNDYCMVSTPKVFCEGGNTAPGRPVTYFLGKGDLTFDLTVRTYRPGGPFFTMTVADVTGDGRDDILTPLVFEDRVVVRPGRVDGTVAEAISVPALDYPWGITTGDVTGDGLRDLVQTHGPRLVSVTPALAGGGFGVPFGYITQLPTGDPFVADLDRNGRKDVLVVEPSSAEVFLQT